MPHRRCGWHSAGGHTHQRLDGAAGGGLPGARALAWAALVLRLVSITGASRRPHVHNAVPAATTELRHDSQRRGQHRRREGESATDTHTHTHARARTHNTHTGPHAPACRQAQTLHSPHRQHAQCMSLFAQMRRRIASTASRHRPSRQKARGRERLLQLHRLRRCTSRPSCVLSQWRWGCRGCRRLEWRHRSTQ